MPVVRVFVSATSTDLRSYRKLVKDLLDRHEIYAVVQENRPADFRTVASAIRGWLAPCDAAICLIGMAYGESPHGDEEHGLSYTQLEYELARELKKPVYLFFARQDCRFDAQPTESPEAQQRQCSFRERIRAGNSLWYEFSTPGDLEEQVVRIVPHLQRLCGDRILHFIHRPERAQYFVGREREMEDLGRVARAAAPSLIAVIGMPGQGKTTLVLEWLLRDKNHLSFETIVWCTAYRGGFTFDHFLDAVLQQFDPSFNKPEHMTVEVRVVRVLDRLQGRRCLLIIDGIERWLVGWNTGLNDPTGASSRQQRMGFFPGLDDFLKQVSSLDSGSHVLFTTRAMPAVLDDLLCATVPVYEMSRAILEGLDDASALDLMRRIGVKDAEPIILREARRYGSHPLSLRVLAALAVKEHGGILANLAHRVVGADSRTRVEELLNEVCTSLPGRRLAQRLLEVAALCLEVPSIKTLAAVIKAAPLGAWIRILDALKLRPDLIPRPSPDLERKLTTIAEMLHDWQLVQWDPQQRVVRLHPIIQEYFRLRAPDSDRLHRAFARWYFSQRTPQPVLTRQDSRDRRLAIEHALAANESQWCAHWVFGPYTPTHSYLEWLKVHGHLEDGRLLLRKLADGSTGLLRGEFLLARVGLSQELSRYEESLTELAECQQIFSAADAQADGTARINLAKTIACRGNVHRETGRSTDAVRDFTSSLETLAELPHSPDATRTTVQTLINRANALLDLARWSEALRDYNDAAAILRERADLLVAETLHRASLLGNRGIAHGLLEHYPEAYADLDAAIRLCEEMRRDNVEEAKKVQIHAIITKAATLRAAGQLTPALQLIMGCVAQVQQAVDSGRTDAEPLLALALLNRTSILVRSEHWNDARDDAERTVILYRRLLVDGRPQLAGSLAHAYLLRASARFHLGDTSGASADLTEGMTQMRALITEWRGECDILIVFLEKATEAVVYLAHRDRDQAQNIAREVIQELASAKDDRAEGMVKTVRSTAGILASMADELGLQDTEHRFLKALVE